MQALDNFEAAWFTPESEADADQPTRFLTRGLDGVQQATVVPYINIDAAGELDISPRGMAKLLEFGLVDWENLQGSAGVPVPFPDTAAAAQRLLPFTVQSSIAADILAKTNIMPADKKK